MGKRIIQLLLVFAMVIVAGCTRSQRPDETADDFAKYRKAFHSAEVVYGIDALGDITEIFKEAGVLGVVSAKAAIELNDQVLIGVDEFTKLLEQGLPPGKFEKARAAIKAFKAAVDAGAVKFDSPKGQSYYVNIISGLEVTLNLVEAFANRDQNRIKQLSAQRAVAVRALRDDAKEIWWTRAIVRTTLLATEINGLSPLDAAQIWPSVRTRSGQTHDKNKVRLSAWQ